jgi:hypothetical protein
MDGRVLGLLEDKALLGLSVGPLDGRALGLLEDRALLGLSVGPLDGRALHVGLLVDRVDGIQLEVALGDEDGRPLGARVGNVEEGVVVGEELGQGLKGGIVGEPVGEKMVETDVGSC